MCDGHLRQSVFLPRLWAEFQRRRCRRLTALVPLLHLSLSLPLPPLIRRPSSSPSSTLSVRPSLRLYISFAPVFLNFPALSLSLSVSLILCLSLSPSPHFMQRWGYLRDWASMEKISFGTMKWVRGREEGRGEKWRVWGDWVEWGGAGHRRGGRVGGVRVEGQWDADLCRDVRGIRNPKNWISGFAWFRLNGQCFAGCLWCPPPPHLLSTQPSLSNHKKNKTNYTHLKSLKLNFHQKTLKMNLTWYNALFFKREIKVWPHLNVFFFFFAKPPLPQMNTILITMRLETSVSVVSVLFVYLCQSSLYKECFSSINSLFSSTVQAPFSTSNYTVPLTSIQCLSPRDVPPQNKRSHNTCNLV